MTPRRKQQAKLAQVRRAAQGRRYAEATARLEELEALVEADGLRLGEAELKEMLRIGREALRWGGAR